MDKVEEVSSLISETINIPSKQLNRAEFLGFATFAARFRICCGDEFGADWESGVTSGRYIVAVILVKKGRESWEKVTNKRGGEEKSVTVSRRKFIGFGKFLEFNMEQ